MVQHPVIPRMAARLISLLFVALLAGGALLANELWQNRPRSVPPVDGLELAAAQQALKNAGFEKVTPRRQPDSRPPDVVIRQAPLAGARHRPGNEVVILVSDGPVPFELPDVRKLRVADAERILGEQGLRVLVEAKTDPDVGAGFVIDQTPPPLQEVRPGDVITIVVSTGAQQVEVPTVENDQEQAAIAKLSAKKLESRTITRPVTDEAQVGRVISQTPAGGNKVNEGALVTITVGAKATDPP